MSSSSGSKADVSRPKPGSQYGHDEVFALLAHRRRLVGRNLSISYLDSPSGPLHIVRGRGAYLYDAAGNQYLDVVNNVAHVGHSHAAVRAAACAQLELVNTNTRYLSEGLLRYASALLATFPARMRDEYVVFLTCTGSEANDLALRIARHHTRREHVVCVDGAYHGSTTATMAVSPYKFFSERGDGKPEAVSVVPIPDVYRGRHRGELSDRALGERYAQYVADAVRERAPAAFIVESVLGCAGQIPLPSGYLEASFAAVRARGGVCIVDEVQVGFGRVGAAFWGFELHGDGVTPDIVTLGKPIGNGFPLGAVVVSRALANSFGETAPEFFNTFAGSNVACAVGMAVLDVIRDEGLQENARRVGERLMAGLRRLQQSHSAIGDVRGVGLFVGVEIVCNRTSREPDAAAARRIAWGMRERRILISTDGPDHNVLKMKPPLVFSEQDADHLLRSLDEVLSAASEEKRRRRRSKL